MDEDKIEKDVLKFELYKTVRGLVQEYPDRRELTAVIEDEVSAALRSEAGDNEHKHSEPPISQGMIIIEIRNTLSRLIQACNKFKALYRASDEEEFRRHWVYVEDILLGLHFFRSQEEGRKVNKSGKEER